MLLLQLILASCLVSLIQTYPYDYEKMGPLAQDIVDYHFYGPSFRGGKKQNIYEGIKADKSYHDGINLDIFDLIKQYPQTPERPYNNAKFYQNYAPELKYDGTNGISEARSRPVLTLLDVVVEKLIPEYENNRGTQFIQPLLKTNVGHDNFENENLILFKDLERPWQFRGPKTINNPIYLNHYPDTQKSDSRNLRMRCIESAVNGQFPMECKYINLDDSVHRFLDEKTPSMQDFFEDFKNLIRINNYDGIKNYRKHALNDEKITAQTNNGHEISNRGRNINTKYENDNEEALGRYDEIKRRKYSINDAIAFEQYRQKRIPKAPHEPILEPDSTEDIDGNMELEHTTPIPTPESGEGPDRSQCYVGFNEYRFKGSDSCLAQIVPFTKEPFPKFTQSDLVIY